MSTSDTPAWAYERAYSRSYKHTLNAEKLKSIYAEDKNPEARVMRAFAAHIAATEQPPVDPDVEFVKRFILALRPQEAMANPYTYFDGTFRMVALERGVAWYKQNKESAQ